MKRLQSRMRKKLEEHSIRNIDLPEIKISFGTNSDYLVCCFFVLTILELTTGNISFLNVNVLTYL